MSEERIWKGINYFRSLKPSQFDFIQYGYLMTLLNLVEAYMKKDNSIKEDLKQEKPEKPEKTVEELVDEVFT